jgi:hypothetical protein
MGPFECHAAACGAINGADNGKISQKIRARALDKPQAAK